MAFGESFGDAINSSLASHLFKIYLVLESLSVIVIIRPARAKKKSTLKMTTPETPHKEPF